MPPINNYPYPPPPPPQRRPRSHSRSSSGGMNNNNAISSNSPVSSSSHTVDQGLHHHGNNNNNNNKYYSYDNTSTATPSPSSSIHPSMTKSIRSFRSMGTATRMSIMRDEERNRDYDDDYDDDGGHSDYGEHSDYDASYYTQDEEGNDNVGEDGEEDETTIFANESSRRSRASRFSRGSRFFHRRNNHHRRRGGGGQRQRQENHHFNSHHDDGPEPINPHGDFTTTDNVLLSPRADIWIYLFVSSLVGAISLSSSGTSSTYDTLTMTMLAVHTTLSGFMAIMYRYQPTRRLITRISPRYIPILNSLEMLSATFGLILWALAMTFYHASSQRTGGDGFTNFNNSNNSNNNNGYYYLNGGSGGVIPSINHTFYQYDTNSFLALWISGCLNAYLLAEGLTTSYRYGLVSIHYTNGTSSPPSSLSSPSSSSFYYCWTNRINSLSKLWILQFLSSICLLSFSTSLQNGTLCQGPLLKRTPYCQDALVGILSGVFGMIFTLIFGVIYRLYTMHSLSQRAVVLIGGGLSLALLFLYTIHVSVVNASSGPGANLGDMFIIGWLNFGVAFALVVRYVGLYFASGAVMHKRMGNRDNRNEGVFARQSTVDTTPTVSEGSSSPRTIPVPPPPQIQQQQHARIGPPPKEPSFYLEQNGYEPQGATAFQALPPPPPPRSGQSNSPGVDPSVDGRPHKGTDEPTGMTYNPQEEELKRQRQERRSRHHRSSSKSKSPSKSHSRSRSRSGGASSRKSRTTGNDGGGSHAMSNKRSSSRSKGGRSSSRSKGGRSSSRSRSGTSKSRSRSRSTSRPKSRRGRSGSGERRSGGVEYTTGGVHQID